MAIRKAKFCENLAVRINEGLRETKPSRRSNGRAIEETVGELSPGARNAWRTIVLECCPSRSRRYSPTVSRANRGYGPLPASSPRSYFYIFACFYTYADMFEKCLRSFLLIARLQTRLRTISIRIYGSINRGWLASGSLAWTDRIVFADQIFASCSDTSTEPWMWDRKRYSEIWIRLMKLLKMKLFVIVLIWDKLFQKKNFPTKLRRDLMVIFFFS